MSEKFKIIKIMIELEKYNKNQELLNRADALLTKLAAGNLKLCPKLQQRINTAIKSSDSKDLAQIKDTLAADDQVFKYITQLATADVNC